MPTSHSSPPISAQVPALALSRISRLPLKYGSEPLIKKLYSAKRITKQVSPTMKLLIRNLARTVTENELRTMFEACGNVQSCNLVIDAKTGSSKGFGFVEMPKPGDAKAAIKMLNGKDIAGSKIRVKKAEARLETGATGKT